MLRRRCLQIIYAADFRLSSACSEGGGGKGALLHLDTNTDTDIQAHQILDNVFSFLDGPLHRQRPCNPISPAPAPTPTPARARARARAPAMTKPTTASTTHTRQHHCVKSQLPHACEHALGANGGGAGAECCSNNLGTRRRRRRGRKRQAYGQQGEGQTDARSTLQREGTQCLRMVLA